MLSGTFLFFKRNNVRNPKAKVTQKTQKPKRFPNLLVFTPTTSILNFAIRSTFLFVFSVIFPCAPTRVEPSMNCPLFSRHFVIFGLLPPLQPMPLDERIRISKIWNSNSYLDRRIYRVCVSSSSVRIDSCRARSNVDTSACEPAELGELFRSILLAPREIGRATIRR